MGCISDICQLGDQHCLLVDLQLPSIRSSWGKESTMKSEGKSWSDWRLVGDIYKFPQRYLVGIRPYIHIWLCELVREHGCQKRRGSTLLRTSVHAVHECPCQLLLIKELSLVGTPRTSNCQKYVSACGAPCR